jgi:hypothetical protein
MARLSWTQRLYWRYFSKPVGQRALMLHVLENPVASILEIGIGSGARIKKLLPLCRKPDGISQIRYVGVDAFESSPKNSEHMNLKAAHKMLAEFGVKAHLIPGEFSNALPRVAHTVMPSDLLIIDGEWGTESADSRLISDWLPRLCHSQSAVFACAKLGGAMEKLTLPTAVTEQLQVLRAA